MDLRLLAASPSGSLPSYSTMAVLLAGGGLEVNSGKVSRWSIDYRGERSENSSTHTRLLSPTPLSHTAKVIVSS